MTISLVVSKSIRFGLQKRSLRVGIMSYFKSMFEKPQVSRPNMVVYLFNCIDRLDRAV